MVKNIDGGIQISIRDLIKTCRSVLFRFHIFHGYLSDQSEAILWVWNDLICSTTFTLQCGWKHLQTHHHRGSKQHCYRNKCKELGSSNQAWGLISGKSMTRGGSTAYTYCFTLVRKKPEFLEKSSKIIEFLVFFFEPKWNPAYTKPYEKFLSSEKRKQSYFEGRKIQIIHIPPYPILNVLVSIIQKFTEAVFSKILAKFPNRCENVH